MKTLRVLAAAFAALTLAGPAVAAEGEYKKPNHYEDWTFAGPFGTFDRMELQRGFQVYQEVCSACHSMNLMSFRNLGEKGGPFRYIPVGTDEDGHPIMEEQPDPNSNPVVRAIAAGYMVTDTEEFDEYGDPVMRPGEPKDGFPSPYPNEAVARLANNNAYPPDLSVITNARHYGADYVRSFLTGYTDPPEGEEGLPGLSYNPYFEGGWVAMPRVLFDDLIVYEDGTEATVDQMAKDVTAFLTWATDPHMEHRKSLGWMVLIYLLIFTIILWISYRQIWSKVEH